MSEGETRSARDTARLGLTPDAAAPRAAREFVRRTCRRWRTPRWEEPAALIVSELVTNVVTHARTPATLTLIRSAAGLAIRVADSAGGDPHIVPAGERTAGGLGLAIVDRLAEEWGVQTRPGGKTVWALIGPDCTPWPDFPGGDEVTLDLPWDKDLVVIARSAAAHLGARSGFTRGEIEDLRLAVDECCALVLSLPVADADTITCRFLATPGCVRFAVQAPLPGATHPPAGEFGWHLLGALVDDFEWFSSDDASGVRATKRREREQ